MNMPNWLGPLMALCVLVGFIAFAFRQGTKVRPNPDGNADSSIDGYAGGGGSHHSSDGHS
jgi:hypothetical protein